ncbi:MAG: aspartate aminotransferase family protein [Legionella sp. 21-45-4]|nr:MAG: aspartate aminotransferase family protein [Legionella sp. 21-45-4]
MALITTYNPLSIAFTHGDGVWLYDETGEAYLDGFSGIAVCGLGHAHPDVTQTIQMQCARLLHTSNGVHIKAQEALAARLTQLTRMSQVFFGNSGAEANEAAIKLARLYGHKKGIEHPAIIVMDGAFHGRTLATLSASSGRKIQAGFEPLVSGFIRAPFNNLEALRAIRDARDDVVAVMLEPIQGEGGVILAEPSYLRAVAALCEENDWLFIVDEIQTGNGRTGSLFLTTSLGIQPDVLTTAKGLANGLPIGACLMSERACDLFKPGSHGSTFGGNPLSCATALTVLDVIERDDICAHTARMGMRLREQLMNQLGDLVGVRAIRGKGLMYGIELDRPAMDIKTLALANRLLVNVTAERVVRLLPPLIITEDELDEMVRRLVKTINTFLKSPHAA